MVKRAVKNEEQVEQGNDGGGVAVLDNFFDESPMVKGGQINAKLLKELLKEDGVILPTLTILDHEKSVEFFDSYNKHVAKWKQTTNGGFPGDKNLIPYLVEFYPDFRVNVVAQDLTKILTIAAKLDQDYHRRKNGTYYTTQERIKVILELCGIGFKPEVKLARY